MESERDVKLAQVFAAAQAPFANLGFERRKQAIHTRELAPSVLGWIGLNVARRRGPIVVTPVVGVRHQRVEGAVARFTDRADDGLAPPTISTPLGTLIPAPGITSFLFDRAGEVDATMTRLADALRDYGMPFMAGLANLEALCHELQANRLGWPHQSAYRLPVALSLSGRVEDAQYALHSASTRYQGRSDLEARAFASFAARFLAARGDIERAGS